MLSNWLPRFVQQAFSRVVAPLIEVEKAVLAFQRLLGPGDPPFGQQGREDARPGAEGGLHPLGERPFDETLCVAGHLAVDDAHGVDGLLGAQAGQLARGGRGPEVGQCRGMDPAAQRRCGQPHTAGQIDAQHDGQDQIPAAAVAAFGHGEGRRQHGGVRVHDGRVVGVVEVPRMGHHAVGQGGGGRRQSLDADHAPQGAFGLAAVVHDLVEQRPHPRGRGTGQGRADGVQDEALGAFDHRGRKVFEAEFDDVVGEGDDGIGRWRFKRHGVFSWNPNVAGCRKMVYKKIDI